MPIFPLLAVFLGTTTLAGLVAAGAQTNRADSESRKRLSEAENFRRERKRMTDELAANEARLRGLESEASRHKGQIHGMAAEILRLRAEVSSLRSQLGYGAGASS